MSREKQEDRGSCLCGAVSFRVTGKPLWVGHCHCRSCQKACAAAFASFAGYPRAKVDFPGLPPASYASSPGVVRQFCPRCGSPISYQGARWPAEIHLFVSNFDRPESFVPMFHVNVLERIPWVHLADDLPQHDDSSDGS